MSTYRSLEVQPRRKALLLAVGSLLLLDAACASEGSSAGAQGGGGVVATGGSPESGGKSAVAGLGNGGTSAGAGGTDAKSGESGNGTGAGGTTANGGAGHGTVGGGGIGGVSGSGGTPTGGGGAVAIDDDALFVAPDGTSDGAGTIGDPLSLSAAVSKVTAGGTIYVRGGKYALSSTIGLSLDGREGAAIDLRAYPLDSGRPLFDFSAMAEGSSNRGLVLSGDYWHLYGLDVFGAGDNCLFISGSHNVVEYSTFSECADSGLQLGSGAADNLVRNCDSYFNADSSLENADGFAAKLDVGTGNHFVGCRAWNNLDDGWDGYLRPADGVTTTYDDCWAIDNGKLKDGSVGAGDGNGFKSGGSDDKDLKHNAIYTRCIAAGNVHDGFDHNSNRGSVTIINSAAHDNGTNINFSTTNIAAALTIKNTISLGTNGQLAATVTDILNNSWQGGLAASATDFVSVDTKLLKSPRKADGSLPDIDYLKLVAGSDLRNAGVDVGLDYRGSAPDLGPFESAD